MKSIHSLFFLRNLSEQTNKKTIWTLYLPLQKYNFQFYLSAVSLPDLSEVRSVREAITGQFSRFYKVKKETEIGGV